MLARDVRQQYDIRFVEVVIHTGFLDNLRNIMKSQYYGNVKKSRFMTQLTTLIVNTELIHAMQRVQ